MTLADRVEAEAVTRLVCEVAAAAITPRFRRLAEADVAEKTAGELVTVADREAEALLAEGLRNLLGVPVVGEEACAADPGLAGGAGDTYWLVDPVDGTQAFVNGSPDHAVMVALVERGTTVLSWIHQPQHRATYVAARGGGAYRDGARIARPPAPADVAALRGGLATRFLDPATRDHVDARGREFGAVVPMACSGIDYPLLATGSRDFLFFRRTLMWDHAPGALLVAEAGGVVRDLAGADYRPGAQPAGIVAAADAATCARVVATLGLPPL